MGILVFSCATEGQSLTGRELLARLNRETFDELNLPGTVIKVCTPAVQVSGVLDRLRRLLGWLDGLTPALVAECVQVIRSRNIHTVYIEGSNYGRLARELRRLCPDCTVITFFHNVEARFFLGALRARPSAHALGVLIANTLAESWAVRHSDRIVCLTPRDGDVLRRLYGRGATHISPLCIARRSLTMRPGMGTERAGLFVGGAFYANVSAMKWFARHVAQLIPDVTIYVVGRGFEAYRGVLEKYPNITVVGEVTSVDEWYEKSAFVLAPIFDGSGMKTKVAEALMYGRPVIGTSEAFVGYEEHVHQAGIRCETPEDFGRAVKHVLDGAVAFDENNLKMLYDLYYSKAAALRYMKRVLSTPTGDVPAGSA